MIHLHTYEGDKAFVSLNLQGQGVVKMLLVHVAEYTCEKDYKRKQYACTSSLALKDIANRCKSLILNIIKRQSDLI